MERCTVPGSARRSFPSSLFDMNSLLPVSKNDLERLRIAASKMVKCGPGISSLCLFRAYRILECIWKLYVGVICGFTPFSLILYCRVYYKAELWFCQVHFAIEYD